MGLKEELSEMRKTMDKLTAELHETNLAIRESLKLTSDAIKQMSDTFSKSFLGIEGFIPDIFKKKSK